MLGMRLNLTILWSRSTPARPRGCWGVGVLLLVCLALAGGVFGATVDARLDRESVSVGEAVALSITVHGGSPEAGPGLPALPNATWGDARQSSSFSAVNGVATSSITFSYDLTPTQPGDIIIPSIQVRVQGQVLATAPLRLRVAKAGEAVAGGPGGAIPAAFVRLAPSKTQVYLGEMFTFDVLFYRTEGDPLQFGEIPAEGFTVGKLQQNKTRTMVQNRPYYVDIFRFPASANKTGPLTLGPVTLLVQVPDPNANQRQDFFGSFFGRPMRRLNLAATATNIAVRPLPTQNVPPGFSGAVGVFNLNVSAGPTTVAVGDPVTVKVQIAGRGQLEGLTLPPQAEWRDFKSYPPESKFESPDPLGLSGTKSFELVVAPQNHEIKALPAFLFSFFDPEQGVYRSLSGPVIPLMVRSAGSTATPTLPGLTNTATPRPQSTDIEPIRVHLGGAVVEAPPLVKQGWFLGLQVIPPALWLAMLGWRKRSESLANNPRLRRQRQVAQTIREGLMELHSLSRVHKSEEFFALLFRLLQEQIGERLDASASSITESVVDEKLEPRGLPKTGRILVHELFKTCNLARYAPVKSSQELVAFIPKLETALAELQKLPDIGGK